MKYGRVDTKRTPRLPGLRFKQGNKLRIKLPSTNKGLGKLRIK